MRDKDLQFDRTCHVLYSKACKREIQGKIALHYPPGEREVVWESVQKQYSHFLSDWRTDLGGKRNFHNGKGGNYDCIALMAYYVVCKEHTNLAEIEQMEGNLFLGKFRKRFVRHESCRPFCGGRMVGRAYARVDNPRHGGFKVVHHGARQVR